jgi:hypothetical protein
MSGGYVALGPEEQRHPTPGSSEPMLYRGPPLGSTSPSMHPQYPICLDRAQHWPRMPLLQERFSLSGHGVARGAAHAGVLH